MTPPSAPQAPAAPLATVVACITCGATVRRFTESKHPMCRACGDTASLVRRDMERAGALPKHSRFNLTGVYTDPLVLAEVRRLVARGTTGGPNTVGRRAS